MKNYSKNNLNQYTAVNSRSYSYDADGNLLSDGTRTFTWDKKNRLTGVVMGTTTVTYVYDHNDLRTKKTVNVQGSTVKVVRYIYDGLFDLLCRDSIPMLSGRCSCCCSKNTTGA